MVTYWEPIEADFSHFYRRDLRADFETEGVRRLWALVSQLPDTARVWAVRNQELGEHGDPDVGEPEPRKVEKDPQAIKAFFVKNLSG